MPRRSAQVGPESRPARCLAEERGVPQPLDGSVIRCRTQPPIPCDHGRRTLALDGRDVTVDVASPWPFRFRRRPCGPSVPAPHHPRCLPNTADQLRSGAPVPPAGGGTGRHLSLPFGCRPELRLLHPLVRQLLRSPRAPWPSLPGGMQPSNARRRSEWYRQVRTDRYSNRDATERPDERCPDAPLKWVLNRALPDASLKSEAFRSLSTGR